MESTKKYYMLFYNKNYKIIRITTGYNLIDSYKKYVSDDGELYRYNECYFVGIDLKKIKQKAEEIRLSWIVEAKLQLESMESVKIERKYVKNKK